MMRSKSAMLPSTSFWMNLAMPRRVRFCTGSTGPREASLGGTDHEAPNTAAETVATAKRRLDGYPTDSRDAWDDDDDIEEDGEEQDEEQEEEEEADEAVVAKCACRGFRFASRKT